MVVTKVMDGAYSETCTPGFTCGKGVEILNQRRCARDLGILDSTKDFDLGFFNYPFTNFRASAMQSKSGKNSASRTNPWLVIAALFFLPARLATPALRAW